MIILVCGYASSGKSVVARYLGKKLDYLVVHTSDVWNKFLSDKKFEITKTKMNKGWYDKSNIKSFREKDNSLDKKLDKYLLSLVKENKNIILDSSTLPYLLKSEKNIIKIWLKATKKIRIERVSKRNKISLIEAKKKIIEKDSFNKRQYKKLYGFDFGKDLSIFDYVLDTTKLSQNQVYKNAYSFVKNKLNE